MADIRIASYKETIKKKEIVTNRYFNKGKVHKKKSTNQISKRKYQFVK